jgi:hypothetical protein
MVQWLSAASAFMFVVVCPDMQIPWPGRDDMSKEKKKSGNTIEVGRPRRIPTTFDEMDRWFESFCRPG